MLVTVRVNSQLSSPWRQQICLPWATVSGMIMSHKRSYVTQTCLSCNCIERYLPSRRFKKLADKCDRSSWRRDIFFWNNFLFLDEGCSISVVKVSFINACELYLDHMVLFGHRLVGPWAFRCSFFVSFVVLFPFLVQWLRRWIFCSKMTANMKLPLLFQAAAGVEVWPLLLYIFS